MNVSDIGVGPAVVITVRTPDGSPFRVSFPPKTEVSLRAADLPNQAWLAWEGQVWEVEGTDRSHQRSLMELVNQHRAHLCWLVRQRVDASGRDELTLQARHFAAVAVETSPVVLNVSDLVVDRVFQNRLRPLLTPVADIIEWLNREIILGFPQAGRVLVSGSPRPWAGLENAFRLYGRDLAVDVIKDNEAAWIVTAVVRLRSARSNEQRPITVLTVPIHFQDATQASIARAQERTELDVITRQSDSYLSLWRRYNEIEQRNILQRARDLGWLRYTECRQLPTGEWRFHLRDDEAEEAALEQLDGRYQVKLEAGERPPQILRTSETDGEVDSDLGQSEASRQNRGRPFVGEVVKIAARQWTIDLRPMDQDDDVKPPERGVLYAALYGEQTRLERRNKAWDRVSMAESEIPWLGKILELRPTDGGDRLKIKLPSDSVLKKLFDGKPTPAQRRALELALNTSDMVLIQGPPGTGKTKTIAALQAILAEVEEVETLAGNTLLTSYQHDAVEHAASKTTVLGLPAVKLGRRHDQTDDNARVDGWRKALANRVREQLNKLPERPLVRALRAVQKAKLSYRLQPTPDPETATILRNILDETGLSLPEALHGRLTALMQQMRRIVLTAESKESMALKRLRALPTAAAAFLDDGPRQIYATLRALQLEGIDLSPADAYLLRQAADWQSSEAPPFMSALADLQQRLLDALQPAPLILARAALRNEAVEELLSDIVDELTEQARKTQSGVELALAEFLDALQYDPAGVQMAVEEYTAVLAATCQQVESRPMMLRKGSERFSFDTVIVDEAARANPLDLLIPMSRAKRRIVLVGDHRQLPHILDPDVERDLQASDTSTQQRLRDSLFHRLFKDFQAQAREGGPERAVTLDQQYRMHPELGRFVSETFYAHHGEGFSSVRPASDFDHHLSGYKDLQAHWIDVPPELGLESRGQSKRRRVEAERVAQEAARILKENDKLSVGIITFYSAQVRAILQALEPEGITDRTEDGWIIRDEFRLLKDQSVDPERLRVGTVDAFQGKEFDVVILSMVRCNELPVGDARALRVKFGFLTLENRLCVAMSRQKRLLIVVGAAAMIKAANQADELRGLVRFWELYGEAHNA